MPEGNERVQALAYALTGKRPEIETIQPIVGRLTRLASWYELQKHEPDLPSVQEAYTAFKAEIVRQFDAAIAVGFRLEPWSKTGQPYATSADMCDDVAEGHLWYFTGGSLPAGHPLKASHYRANLGYIEQYNDMFRVIHDLFGHAMFGYTFGPIGEYRAWLSHSAMFSPLARKALNVETLAQNAWVNFGPFANLRPVVYAQQKACILEL